MYPTQIEELKGGFIRIFLTKDSIIKRRIDGSPLRFPLQASGILQKKALVFV